MQRGWKYFLFAIFVLIFIVVYLQDSGFSTRSREYIKDFLKTHGSGQQTASAIDSSYDETELESSLEQPGFDPLNIPTSHPLAPNPQSPAPVEDASGYQPDKTFFELDLVDYPLPKIDASKLRRVPAHNYKGPGHPTVATFYLSRDSSIYDPYFLSTQEVIYRLLWKPETKSSSHPVVVFVAPYVPDEIRSWFEAVGALVREVDTIAFHPAESSDGGLLAHRFRDVFTKLQMWSQTEFSRIAFLDGDAYPLENVDALLDDKSLVPDQTCHPELLQEEDVPYKDQICSYIFTGARDLTFGDMVNAGVMVLAPNMPMYNLLMRERHNTSNYDPGYPEQAFLSYVFRKDGPFPAGTISSAYNGDPKVKDDGGDLFILHAKLWVLMQGSQHWTDHLFMRTWNELVAFYDGEDFKVMRKMDEVKGEEAARIGRRSG